MHQVVSQGAVAGLSAGGLLVAFGGLLRDSDGVVIFSRFDVFHAGVHEVSLHTHTHPRARANHGIQCCRLAALLRLLYQDICGCAVGAVGFHTVSSLVKI